MGEFEIKAIDRVNYWKVHKSHYVREYLYVRMHPGHVQYMFIAVFSLSGSITPTDGE